MTALFSKPKSPRLPEVKKIPKREDVATPDSELSRRARRRGVAATLLSDVLGGSGKLGVK